MRVWDATITIPSSWGRLREQEATRSLAIFFAAGFTRTPEPPPRQEQHTPQHRALRDALGPEPEDMARHIWDQVLVLFRAFCCELGGGHARTPKARLVKPPLRRPPPHVPIDALLSKH